MLAKKFIFLIMRSKKKAPLKIKDAFFLLNVV